MRFLKKSQINLRNVADNSIAIQIDGEVTMDTTNVLLMPKGADADRPLNPVTGHMRYNTTSNQVEVYQGSTASWRSLRFKEATNIIQQSLGTGDAEETVFGLLNPIPPSIVESGATWGSQNLIVLIENVFQVSTTNYTVVQNPSTGPNAPYAAGWYIVFESAVPLGKPVTVLHGFDK
jgi:hypothetical protein